MMVFQCDLCEKVFNGDTKCKLDVRVIKKEMIDLCPDCSMKLEEFLIENTSGKARRRMLIRLDRWGEVV